MDAMACVPYARAFVYIYKTHKTDRKSFAQQTFLKQEKLFDFGKTDGIRISVFIHSSVYFSK